MKLKFYIKQLLLLSSFFFIWTNSVGQKKSCFNWCYLESLQSYTSENQKNDFDSLSIYLTQIDSIRLLKRIISFDCENKIGKRSIVILDKIMKKKRLGLNGEWVFEWSGSTWGTKSVRSDSIKRKL